jgi:ubiquinone/menaquinone biosynthesis C-methylase UbiE
MKNAFWKKYWTNSDITKRVNLQAQVGRTINRQPIDDSLWDLTLEYIKNQLELGEDDEILDLCGGNGLISIPFSLICKSVILADISETLLNQIDTYVHKNITAIHSDILTLSFTDESFDKVIFYFAIQHFDEKEVLSILQKVFKWLRKGGSFYIGDIPDMLKIWSFYNTKERKRAYFNSILDDKPIIGTWFTKDFLIKAGDFLNYSDCKTLNQPSYQINSHYRFDMILKK